MCLSPSFDCQFHVVRLDLPLYSECQVGLGWEGMKSCNNDIKAGELRNMMESK